MKKKPNKFLAPVVIAGVTIGFFVSAYKFVFGKPSSETPRAHPDSSQSNSSLAQVEPSTDQDQNTQH